MTNRQEACFREKQERAIEAARAKTEKSTPTRVLRMHTMHSSNVDCMHYLHTKEMSGVFSTDRREKSEAGRAKTS
jgi:hypothetical protein